MVTHEEPVTIANPVYRSRISWGAVIAAVFAILAISFLLLLLGSAIGFSVVDVTDLGAIGEGLGVGTVIWVVATMLVVYFIGGFLAARMSGRRTRSAGMMHGVVVWAVALIISLIIDGMLLSGAARGGAAAAEGIATTTMSLGGKVVRGAGMTVDGLTELASSRYTDEIRAELKTAAADTLADVEPAGGASVTEAEIRTAIEKLDPQTLQRVAEHLVAGNVDQARATLLREINLSRREADELLAGVRDRLDETLEESEAVEEARAMVEDRLDTMTANLAQAAGPKVSRAELRKTLSQLDAELAAKIGRHLLTGDVERARQALTANTELNPQEVEAIVSRVESRLAAERKDLVQAFKQDVEAISDYIVAMLWLFFVAYALSLVVAVIGGRVGADDDDTAAEYAAAHSRRTAP